MIVTTIVSLAYYLVVNYLPTGNWLLAITDILPLFLAIGVFTISIKTRLEPKVAIDFSYFFLTP